MLPSCWGDGRVLWIQTEAMNTRSLSAECVLNVAGCGPTCVGVEVGASEVVGDPTPPST
jgi:hypothetical protein